MNDDKFRQVLLNFFLQLSQKTRTLVNEHQRHGIISVKNPCSGMLKLHVADLHRQHRAGGSRLMIYLDYSYIRGTYVD